MKGGISNWLIMKFGTPSTGAGPNPATLSEGLDLVGLPSGLRIGSLVTASVPPPPPLSSPLPFFPCLPLPLPLSLPPTPPVPLSPLPPPPPPPPDSSYFVLGGVVPPWPGVVVVVPGVVVVVPGVVVVVPPGGGLDSSLSV